MFGSDGQAKPGLPHFADDNEDATLACHSPHRCPRICQCSEPTGRIYLFLNHLRGGWTVLFDSEWRLHKSSTYCVVSLLVP